MADATSGSRFEFPWENDAGRWEETNSIGSGAYGIVMKGYDRQDPTKIVAIKKTKIPLCEEGIPQSVIREIAALRCLESSDHPNVVKLLDVVHGLLDNNRELYLYLVFEHCACDLAEYLRKSRQPLSPMKIQSFVQQMLMAAQFLHNNMLIHRDIKPQNVLVTTDGVLKLTDFGLARLYSNQTTFTTVVVTLWYRPCEILLESSYSSAADVWSIGCIFAELILRRPLFAGQSEIEQLVRIFEVIGLPKASEWPADARITRSSFHPFKRQPMTKVLQNTGTDELACRLIEKLLVFDMKNRITTIEALEDPYFQVTTVDYDEDDVMVEDDFEAD